MAITTVNAFYQGTGPTVSAEVLANYSAGQAAINIRGFCLPVLDGSSVNFTLNWIDGTATLKNPPKGVLMFRSDPPLWYAGTTYNVGDIVLGSGHVQQATVAGVTAAVTAPVWKTDGTTIKELASPLTWKDLGAIALVSLVPLSAITITNVSALITFSTAGTSTQVPVFNFELIF